MSRYIDVFREREYPERYTRIREMVQKLIDEGDEEL